MLPHRLPGGWLLVLLGGACTSVMSNRAPIATAQPTFIPTEPVVAVVETDMTAAIHTPTPQSTTAEPLVVPTCVNLDYATAGRRTDLDAAAGSLVSKRWSER
jgi:hypothetical protein